MTHPPTNLIGSWPAEAAEALARIKKQSKRQGWTWNVWIRNVQDERALLEGCRPDPAEAAHVVEFFESFLTHSKAEWAGQPFKLESWQRDSILMPLFGWKRADGTRRFRHSDIWIAKKNGKSTLASGIALYLLTADGEKGAEVYAAAVDRDQASIVFNEAASMVQASPDLSRRLRIFRGTKAITFPSMGSRLKALSADVPTKEGLNASGLIIDELHAWKSRDLWDTLRYAGASRRQPLSVTISTAGFERESIGYQQYQEAKAVGDGIVEDTARFVFIAEAEQTDDWADEATWRKANPNWGVSVKVEQFRADFQEARRSTVQENVFRRYRLNQWTQQHTRWINMDNWDACKADLDLASLAGRSCYGGLDLAITRDTTAFVLVFPDDEAQIFDVFPFFWAPEADAKERERRDEAPYVSWARQGHITLTEGNVTDYGFVRRKINELAGNVTDYDGPKFNIVDIAFDPYNATFFAQKLRDEDGVNMLQMRQGFLSMSEPSKNFERAILDRKLRHNGHPVLRWHVSNVAVRLDPAGNIKPDKEKSTSRIDGVVATVMALARAQIQAECIYNKRGLACVLEWG